MNENWKKVKMKTGRPVTEGTIRKYQSNFI